MTTCELAASGGLLPVKEVCDLIETGATMLIAGDEQSLGQLPMGNWIGGTIPYFMSHEGGTVDRERLFVNILPESMKIFDAKLSDSESLSSIYEDGPAKGVSFIIIPASSSVHFEFAARSHTYPGYLSRPVVGWVSGVHLSDLDTAQPRVFDGRTLCSSVEHAAILHAELVGNHDARIDIINLFEQGDGDVLTFDDTGFEATTVRVNGEKVSLAEYLKKGSVDLRLPLVAEYYGANINVSFQGVDEASGRVSFYAPVFAGMEYRIARPVGDYAREFAGAMPEEVRSSVFSCNCILNFLYGDLEGKKTGGARGPMTFGEIAYQLLNQTFVYIEIV